MMTAKEARISLSGRCSSTKGNCRLLGGMKISFVHSLYRASRGWGNINRFSNILRHLNIQTLQEYVSQNFFLRDIMSQRRPRILPLKYTSFFNPVGTRWGIGESARSGKVPKQKPRGKGNGSKTQHPWVNLQSISEFNSPRKYSRSRLAQDTSEIDGGAVKYLTSLGKLLPYGKLRPDKAFAWFDLALSIMLYRKSPAEAENPCYVKLRRSTSSK